MYFLDSIESIPDTVLTFAPDSNIMIDGAGSSGYNQLTNQTTSGANPYSSGPSNASTVAHGTNGPQSTEADATTSLLKLVYQQLNDLERRSAELDAREAEFKRIQQMNAPKENKFPSFSGFTPCFYQNINEEIESRFQPTVRKIFWFWLYYIGTLVLNFSALLVSHSECADKMNVFTTLVGSIIFIPLSYVFWFKSLYNAFRNNNNVYFGIFFIIFFAQWLLFVWAAIGLKGSGAVGIFMAFESWINPKSSWFTILICSTTALVHIFNVIASTYIWGKVFNIFRETGGSFKQIRKRFKRSLTQTAAKMVKE